MDLGLTVGIKGQKSILVSPDTTAAKFGSGGVEVFATPMMIGLMEGAAMESVDGELPEGYGTVGTHLDVAHLAATPIGLTVTAKSELIEIKGKKLVFKVEAFDEKEKIGEGTHNRYIIDLGSFIKRAGEKKNS